MRGELEVRTLARGAERAEDVAAALAGWIDGLRGRYGEPFIRP